VLMWFCKVILRQKLIARKLEIVSCERFKEKRTNSLSTTIRSLALVRADTGAAHESENVRIARAAQRRREA